MDFLNEDDLNKLPYQALISVYLTSDQLRNMRNVCRIPQTEKIIGIIDTTVFKSGKNGLAFTDKKIHNKSLWVDNFSLTWEAFANCTLKKGVLVVYAEYGNCEYEFSNGVDLDKLYAVLISLQKVITERIAEQNKNESDNSSHQLDESNAAKSSNSELNSTAKSSKCFDGEEILLDLEEIRKSSHGFINFNPEVKQLVNMRRACKIPSSESLYGIIDNTIFGAADEGIAFTEKAIYHKLDYEDPFKFTWKSFVDCDIRIAQSGVYAVLGSTKYKFDCKRSELYEAQLSALLKSLQSLIREKINNAANSSADDVSSTNASSDIDDNENSAVANFNNYIKPTALDYAKLPFRNIFNYEKARRINVTYSPEFYLLKIYALSALDVEPDIVERFTHDVIAAMCIDFVKQNNDKYKGLKIEFIQNQKSFYYIFRAFLCLIQNTIKKLIDKNNIETILYAFIPAFAYDGLDKQLIQELSKNMDNFAMECSEINKKPSLYSNMDFEEKIQKVYSGIEEPKDFLLGLYLEFLDIEYTKKNRTFSPNFEKMLHYTDFYETISKHNFGGDIASVKASYLKDFINLDEEIKHTEGKEILFSMESSLRSTYRKWEPFLAKIYYYIGEHLGAYLDSQQDNF
jgi:hypothetical protein